MSRLSLALIIEGPPTTTNDASHCHAVLRVVLAAILDVLIAFLAFGFLEAFLAFLMLRSLLV